jgi:hypothetical protein
MLFNHPHLLLSIFHFLFVSDTMRFADIGQTLMGSVLLHIASTGTAAYIATRKDIEERGGLRHLMIFSCVLSIFCLLVTFMSLISPGDKLRGKLSLLVFIYILNGLLGGFGCAYAFGLSEKRFRYLLRDEKAVVALSVLGGCMLFNLIAAFLLIRCREVLASLKRAGMLPRSSLWSSFCEDKGDGGSDSSEFEHDPTYKGRSEKPSFGNKKKRGNETDESASSDEEEQLLRPGVGIGAPHRPIEIVQNDDNYGPPQIGRGVARAQDPFPTRGPAVERLETVVNVRQGRGIARPQQVDRNTVNDSVHNSSETEGLGGLVRAVGKPRPAVVSVAPGDSVYSNETERLGGLSRGVGKARQLDSVVSADSAYSNDTGRLGGLSRGVARADKKKPLRTEHTMEVNSSAGSDVDDGRISSVGGAIPRLGGKRL